MKKETANIASFWILVAVAFVLLWTPYAIYSAWIVVGALAGHMIVKRLP